MDTLDDLRANVAQLERDRKRQRWTNVGLLVCGLLGVGAMNAQTQNVTPTAPQDLVVRSLKVVAPDGTERITLKADEYYGHIRIVNAQQKPQLILGSRAFGGTIILSDNSGRPLGAFHAGDGGVLSLFAKSEKHKKGRYVGASIQASEEYSGLMVMDHAGNVLAEVPKNTNRPDGG